MAPDSSDSATPGKETPGKAAPGTAEPDTAAPQPKPLVLRVSPMAHLATGFFALGLLIPIQVWPVSAPLLLIPVLLSALIVRWRTVVDAETVTVRGLLSSRTVRWDEIDGLRFTKARWARAHLAGGEEIRLPAVTFSTLPLLTEASGGRVPNPYR